MPGQLHSALLTAAGFRHAFFTRNGGASEGPYAQLNFSLGVGDDPGAVATNFALAAAALGVATERLLFASQVHEADVLELSGNESPSAVLAHNADAVVSGRPDLACAVRIADCVPLLFADPLTGRAAAVHAGWRGLVRGVIPAAARVLGGDPRGWLVAIGPHIRVGAFEVSEETARELEACCPGAAVAVRAPERKPHVDLAAVACWQLQTLGVPETQIDVLPGCTHAEADRFFSFRRDGKISGRHLAAIVPKLSV